MSRTIDITITDSGTSVKVTNNNKVVIEATIAEPRQLLLNEAAGKITVLKNKNDQVLNDFDIIYNQVNDKLGTTTVKEFYNKLIELRAFKKGGGGDKHIKELPADPKYGNFYYRETSTLTDPKGLYAYISLTSRKRLVQDLGRVDAHTGGGNEFSVYWDHNDLHVIHAGDTAESSVIVTFQNKVPRKTITILINPLDKTLILDEIPADQLTDLKPNEWNIIYVHFLGNFQKSNLGLGASGTVNLYNVQIKQPVIV